jgi:hypothetical protein
MRPSKFLFIFFLWQCTTVYGQQPVRHAKAKIISEPGTLNYEIIHIDTIDFHYSSGKYNDPDAKKWDSTKIWADIILKNAPNKIDSSKLKLQIFAIMKRHGISKASVFRDEYSSLLAKLSSAYAYKKLKERHSYFGIFEVD